MDGRRFVITILGVVGLAIASIYCLYQQEPVWAIVFGLLCLEGMSKFPDEDDYSNEEVEVINKKIDEHNKRVDEHNARIKENNDPE